MDPGVDVPIERAQLEARSVAAQAWDLVGADARAARVLAREVVAGSADDGARSVAYRALGLAALELQSADACAEHMRASLVAAERTGDQTLIAEAEMGLAAARFSLGERGRALRLSRRAVRRAPDVPRLVLQLGVILERAGDVREATRAYDRAETLAEHAGDDETLVRVLCNRGVLLTYAGDLSGAERDLTAARRLAPSRGPLADGICVNLAFLAARRGDIVAALADLDAVTEGVAGYGGLPLGVHQLDRCEVLLLAGLAQAAAEAGVAATRAFSEARMGIELAEARVAAGQAALIAGKVEAAKEHARYALQALRREPGAVPWAALAEEIVVRATWMQGRRDARLARRAQRAAEALGGAGWRSSAASARILAARIELQLGRRERAAEQLQLVRDTPRSPVGLRIQARAATALLRREAGDRRGARAALRSAWELLERHRATLGATELRAGATAHVAEIVDIALEMAIEDRRPREVLRWAERGRVGALTPRATAPPVDPELARLLGELRVVAAEADAAAKRGDDSRALLRRQAQIEERVRGRARLLPPEEGGGAAPTVDAPEILTALGDRALLEYVVSGDDLWAVIGAGGRFSLRRICTTAQIADEADGLRVALRRLAFGSPVPQLRAAARQGAEYARGRLRQLLFDPIADLIGDRRRVIVPMGALHAVPWSALHDPSEPYVVAPSASLWARASAQSPRPGGALLVAGPRLAEADAEVESIAAVIASPPAADIAAGERRTRQGMGRTHDAVADAAPSADAAPTVLTGDAATVDAVREAMGDAALAHLACHGRFRADNPLFSSLELHDGALSVFELERLGRAPARIILSACDAGLSAVHPGDELLGLAAALLRLGTTGIVASVLPVPDGATRRLMEALHHELSAGAGLADALAAARAELDRERDDDLVASWAFQVLGAG